MPLKLSKRYAPKGELLDSFNAFFQIRIRIGASIGEVNVGNFGPAGAKQWDVIGEPVIIAKRMETTAPVGGVRISEDFYKILDSYGIVKDYCKRLQKEAVGYNSPYRDIDPDEVFSYSNVNIKEKKNAKFHSYSVQVNANLPNENRRSGGIPLAPVRTRGRADSRAHPVLPGQPLRH
jgi:adenylate cyclase